MHEGPFAVSPTFLPIMQTAGPATHWLVWALGTMALFGYEVRRKLLACSLPQHQNLVLRDKERIPVTSTATSITS